MGWVNGRRIALPISKSSPLASISLDKEVYHATIKKQCTKCTQNPEIFTG